MSGHHQMVAAKSDMGYFDGLISVDFRTMPDGRRLFMGHALASEQQYQQLRQQLKASIIVGMALIMVACFVDSILLLVVVTLLLTALYLAWLQNLRRELKVSRDWQSPRESLLSSLTSSARAYGAAVLWRLETGSLVFVCVGTFVFLTNPSQQLVALASTAFFGLCAIVFAGMLVLERRSVARSS